MRYDPLSNHDYPVDHEPDCGEDHQSDGPVDKAAEKSAVNVTAGIQVANDPVSREKGDEFDHTKNDPFIQWVNGQRKWVGKLVKNEAKQFSQ